MWRERIAVAGVAAVLLGAGLANAESLDDRLKKANPAKGETVFDGCRGCHSIEDGGPTLLGPNLWSVINRPVAGVDGFEYSEALKEFGGTWELGRLDEFLADPSAIVPGTRMAVGGVEDRFDRANLIAYLNQNSANPLPIGLPPGSTPAADESEVEKKRDFGLLVEAPGVEKTQAYCTPCHSDMIIVQQGKTRKRWDDALTWMTEEQGMVDIQDPDRETILDYLEANYNEDRPNFPKR
jgi:cytochrome c